MSHGPRNKRRRLRLLAQSPVCHWCGKEVREDVRETAANRATLDHVEDRIERGSRRTPVVLACYSCNKNRNVARGKARVGKRIDTALVPFLKMECVV